MQTTASLRPVRALLTHSRSLPHLDVVLVIEREAVVDALWQHDHITLLALDTDPPVLGISHIKIP
jgi:hypothetical protein